MKLNCGMSREAKRLALEAELPAYREWHDYFAWWPTRVAEGDCRWLETIERKWGYVALHYRLPDLFCAYPEYRAKTKE